MISYNFKAKTSQGKIVAGIVKSNSSQLAVQELKHKNYYLIKLKKQSFFDKLSGSDFSFIKYVTTKDKAVFTHQLGTMLHAGLKMNSALLSLSKQTTNKQLTAAIKQISSDIEQSDSLAQALSKHPKIFSKVYVSIVNAAEQTGALPETLGTLSGQLKSQSSTNAKIKSALAYPVFLLLASVAVVGVLMTFVIPKFLTVFVNANQQLPTATRILVFVTEAVKQFWPVMIVIGVVAGCLISLSLKARAIRKHYDKVVLNLPVIGAFNKKIQLARFTRTLGALLNGGVKMIPAIQTTAGVASNMAFAEQVREIEHSITKGSTLANAIRQQNLFSEIAANMISVGEETSKLAEMLNEVAEMHEEQCENAVNSLTSLLGPAMIVVLGMIIAFVVMAILMPIFETSTMVG